MPRWFHLKVPKVPNIDTVGLSSFFFCLFVFFASYFRYKVDTFRGLPTFEVTKNVYCTWVIHQGTLDRHENIRTIFGDQSFVVLLLGFGELLL